jgi:acetyl esterase/lipase
MRFPLLAVAAFATGLSQPAWAQSRSGIQSFPDVVFAEPDGHKLQLDLLVPKSAAKPPLVVYIHGGGWQQSSRKEFPFAWLAEHGFAVASIDYRLTHQAIYPAQIHDCKGAVRWLRAHADKYGYDASRIVVMGSSAGAHLSVLLGTTAGKPELEGTIGGNSDRSSKVDAVVDYYGATDFILRAKTQPDKTNEPGSIVYKLLDGPPGENEALAKLASGAWQVTPDDAPLLIFQGDADKTVLPDQSQRLYDAAKAADLDVAIHYVPKAAHSITPFLTESNRKLVLDFLAKHLRTGTGDL